MPEHPARPLPRAADAPRAATVARNTRLLQTASLLTGLLLWEAVASQFSHFILPAPSAVVARVLQPGFAGPLAVGLGHALRHMAVGFALTLAAAIPLGILIGRWPRLNAAVEPVLNAFYAIPPVAFVPFLIIWFGLFFEARVALVFMMSFPDVLVVIIAGARDVRRQLVDAGRSFGASGSQVLRLVVLPATMPFVFASLRVGAARAINGMITAELFFAAVNLGKIMKVSAERFDTAGALAVVVLVCLVGLAAQSLLRLLETRLLAWHVRDAP